MHHVESISQKLEGSSQCQERNTRLAAPRREAGDAAPGGAPRPASYFGMCLKLAVTLWAPVMLTAQEPVPVQAPLQPVK